MKLTPLADRVVLKMTEPEETTKGGIILTGSAKEKPSVAEVISVGPGGTVDGKTVTMTVKPGDKVITDKYAGTKVLLDEVIGAWATYGDSIPIDGLAESINETIQVGKVTGVFADALNWAGVNEDYFNQQLSATAARSERAAIIMEQLRTQGLEATGQAWQENNQSMITYNQTQDKITQKTAEFGRTLRPVAQTLQEVKLGLMNLGQDFWDNFSSFGKRALAARDQSKISGSHANGLDYVPYDGYVAELHRGEAVLTSNEADALRGLRRSGSMLGGGGAVSAGPAVQSASAQPAVYDLTIPVELTIDGATFARKEYKYRIAEDARRGSPLTGKGGR